MHLKKNNILVVGGAGYVGSHVAKLLQKSGYNTIVLDNLSTGHRNAARDLPFYEGSCGDTNLVTEILEKHQIQTVMHFSAKALVGESVQNPLLYYHSNVSETINLLTAMRSKNVKRFIFSSTCATFGEPKEVPIHEKVTQNPVNPYGWSKLFVEQILKDCLQAYGFSSAILRYFNAAGADPDGELGEDHQPETHLIPRVLAVAFGRDPILTINGTDYPTTDGTCVRDYIHVNDLGLAHIQAMEKFSDSPACLEFNLGTEKGYSVQEVIASAQKITGKKINTQNGPRRPGDPPVLIADSSYARKVLGWKPQFDLDSIVRTTAGWMTKHPLGFKEKS